MSKPAATGGTKDGGSTSKSTPANPLRVDQSFLTLRSELDRLFEDFLKECRPPFRWRGAGYNPFARIELEIGDPGEVMPRADMTETEDGFLLTLELPGVDEDDIEVALAEGVLTVYGDKRPHNLHEGIQVHMAERHYGPFRRSFRVPSAADQDSLRATTSSGVLTVYMPKAGD